MAAMVQTGLDVSPVITDRLAFSDWRAAVERAESGSAGKVILDFTTASEGA